MHGIGSQSVLVLEQWLPQKAPKMGPPPLLCARNFVYLSHHQCKVMVTNTWSGTADIHVQESTVEMVDEFCYLGSYIIGCAVAQHCCNDDQQSQWENGDFDPL